MNIPTELSRIFLHDSRANPVTGEVRWSPIKSLWVFTHTLLAIIGGAVTLSLDAVAIFIITTATTLFAHNSGEMDNEVLDAAVQGHNVKWVAHLTMGESWHNNHHAYPGSALLGLYANQAAPGWRVLNALHNLGLVWNIVLPENLPSRANLRPLTSRATQGYGEKHLAECAILKALS